MLNARPVIRLRAPTGRWGAPVAEVDRGGRPLPRLAVQRHRPAEAFAQPAHDGQAHALAGDVVRIGPVERVEGPLQGARVHADAGVADDDPVGLDAHFDPALFGEGAGIEEQVAQHHREHAW